MNNIEQLVNARKSAEEAVAGMAEGPFKLKAFEVILGSLVSTGAGQVVEAIPAKGARSRSREKATSLASRIEILAGEGYLSEPRSLSEIQAKLAEHGWHYAQTNLSTPLIRLVRQRQLRRLQLVVGSKRVWKYSVP